MMDDIKNLIKDGKYMSKMLLKNCTFVDGSQKDILIERGKITCIDYNIPEEEDVIINTFDGCYVSAGWIDIHTHCFEKFSLYSDDIDTIGYKSGVTTIIDAGTSGADDIDEFYEDTKKFKTNVYSLLNISKIGLIRQNELANMKDIDHNKCIEACHKYPNFIVGIKARMSKSVVRDNGDLPLFEAIKIANQVKLPLMVHVGNPPSNIEVVLNHLRKGDIITHIFNLKIEIWINI